jgi:hypothetical protein
MVIAVAISPAELGPSPDPILAACSGDDVPVDGLGVDFEAFVKMAASGELGDSPSRPVQTEIKAQLMQIKLPGQLYGRVREYVEISVLLPFERNDRNTSFPW